MDREDFPQPSVACDDSTAYCRLPTALPQRYHPHDETAALIVAAARGWIGTPYRHQGSKKGVGCDCLGLVRGIWRAVYGGEPERPAAYAADWAEAGGEDLFLAAARRHCREKAINERVPGDLLLFRWRPHLPAKHAGILVSHDRFIHAYQGHCVTVSSLVPQWRQRIAAVFSFPEVIL